MVDAGAAGAAPRVLRRGDNGIAGLVVSPYRGLCSYHDMICLQKVGADVAKASNLVLLENTRAASSLISPLQLLWVRRER